MSKVVQCIVSCKNVDGGFKCMPGAKSHARGIVKDLKYADSHEWLKVDGNSATVGITDHAQDHLGDVVYVELPEVGVAVTQGGSFGAVESVKASSDIYSPVSGKVVEVNEELNNSPGLVSHPIALLIRLSKSFNSWARSNNSQVFKNSRGLNNLGCLKFKKIAKPVMENEVGPISKDLKPIVIIQRAERDRVVLYDKFGEGDNGCNDDADVRLRFQVEDLSLLEDKGNGRDIDENLSLFVKKGITECENFRDEFEDGFSGKEIEQRLKAMEVEEGFCHSRF
ncbi:unnamed protein product [Ilex paraguariensis]|uniref:Glycine cleavage system H protein n=1 Tax=Ilex paraguariensis TaxID=185542 RepID=A0ABC8V1C7_9AQUA